MIEPTETELKSIKKWIQRRTENIFHYDFDCPFHSLSECRHCYNLFPKMPKGDCPCGYYSFKYVIKRAKKWVKEAKHD